MTRSASLVPAPAPATLAVGLTVGLSLSLFASAAAAQGVKVLSPVLTSTLDVCAIDGTDKWRYSGVVTVIGAEGRRIEAEHRIQNQTSRRGYRTVLGAKSATARVGVGATDAVVLPYVLEAAPLTLGVLRSASEVELRATSRGRNGLTIVSLSAPVTADNVASCTPAGCVQTQGYWGNKPNVVWPAAYSRTAPFFSSGLSWQKVLDTPPRGSGYNMLAQQYIAAVLNRAAGATAPAGVQAVIDRTSTWLRSGATMAACGPGQCPVQKTWAATLDAYNDGRYPGGPKGCK